MCVKNVPHFLTDLYCNFINSLLHINFLCCVFASQVTNYKFSDYINVFKFLLKLEHKIAHLKYGTKYGAVLNMLMPKFNGIYGNMASSSCIGQCTVQLTSKFTAHVIFSCVFAGFIQGTS